MFNSTSSLSEIATVLSIVSGGFFRLESEGFLRDPNYPPRLFGLSSESPIGWVLKIDLD